MSKKLICMILAAAMLVSLAACGGDPEGGAATGIEITNEAPKNPLAEGATISTSDNRYDKVTIAYPVNMVTIGPDKAIKIADTACFEALIFEGLFQLVDGDYFPVLATGYEKVDDLHWTVTIYDYIYDSEGNHITADDVVYSYELAQNVWTIPKYTYLDHVSKVGDFTVEFTWTEAPDELLALEFIWCGTAIVSQTAYENHDFATDPIGTGPYTVTEFEADSKLIIDARDDYWQTEELRPRLSQANVQTIEFDVLTEAAQRVIALETGSADFAYDVASENLTPFLEGGGMADRYQVYAKSTSTLYTLNPNCDPCSPCSDVNLRLAIYYAISNELLAAGVGDAVAARGLGSSFYSNYDPAWDEEQNYINEFNLELAKQYLDKSSYNGETLEIQGSSVGLTSKLAEIIQNLLLEIKINTHITVLDATAWNIALKDPTNFDMQLMISGGNGSNIVFGWDLPFNTTDWGTGKTIGMVDDPKIDAYMSQLYTLEGNTAENISAFRDHWMENAYTYPLVIPTQNVVYSNCFNELYFNCDGFLLPNACTYILN